MRRSIIKFFISSVLFFITVVFLTPYVISTKSGQKQFFKTLSFFLDEKIEIKNLDLSWFGSQRLDGLQYQSHLIDVYVEEISTRDSLLKWLFNRFTFSNLTIFKADGVIRTTAKKPISTRIPFKSLKLISANLQIQTADKNYKFKPVNLDIDLSYGLEIKSKGNLSLGLESGNFFALVSQTNNQINHLEFQTEFLPTYLLEDLFSELQEFNLSKIIGSKLQGNLLFDRKTKSFSCDLKTDQGFIKYPESKTNNLIVEIKQPGGNIKITGKELALNYENLFLSSFTLNLDVPNLGFGKTEINSLKSKIDFSQDDLIQISAAFKLYNEKINGDFESSATIRKDLKSLNLSMTSPSLKMIEPITQTWQDIKIKTLKAKFENSQWNGKIEVLSEIDPGKSDNMVCNFETSKTFSIFQIPSLAFFKIDSKIIKANIDFDLKTTLSTHSSAYFNIEVPDRIAKQISPKLDLEKPITINGMIDKGSSIESLSGIFSIPQMKFSSNDSPLDVSFQKGSFKLNLKKTTGSLYLNGGVNQGSFAVDIDYESLKNYETKLRLVNLPVASLDLFLNLDKTAKNFIGKTITGNLNLHAKPNNQALSLSLTTDQGFLKLSGELQDKFFLVTKPSKISFNFKSIEENTWFKKHDLFIISEPKLSLDIQELIIPVNLDFNDLVINSKFEILDLKFFSEHEIAALDQLTGECRKKKNEPLQAYLSSDAKIGKIDGKAVIEKVNFQPISNLFSSIMGIIELDLKNVPSVFLKAASAPFLNEKFTSLLSDRSNLFFRLDTKQYPKRLSLNIDSSDLQLLADGVIEGTTFILKKPLDVSLNPNEAFKSLFYDYTAIHFVDSRSPLELEISSKGFMLPLENTKIENIQIPYFKLSLGQIDVRNDGTMSLTDTFFKKKLGNLIRLWFQPAEFQFKNGIINIGRFDVLILPNMQVAFWGKIDMKNSYVDCILGLTAQSLKNTLGISDLPKDFVLTVPVRGKFGEVKIDKSQALTKIATLLASKQNFSGQFGGIIDFMNQMMNDQGKIPKPRRPFPWEKPVSFDLETKKDFLLKFKQHSQERELLSYSLSLDPIIHMIQEQINQLTEPAVEEDDSLVNNPDELPNNI